MECRSENDSIIYSFIFCIFYIKQGRKFLLSFKFDEIGFSIGKNVNE